MRQYLIDLRKKSNFTQQVVADKIHCTRQYYNLIENGNRQKSMDISLVLKLSKALQVSAEYIMQQEQKLVS